jgi:hypothetical protein
VPADVSAELTDELLRKLDTRFDKVVLSSGVVRKETNPMRGTMVSRQKIRLDRIEHRLELRELAETQARFEPHT